MLTQFNIKKLQESEDCTTYLVDGFLKVEERKGVFRVTSDGKKDFNVTEGSASIEDAVNHFIQHYAKRRKVDYSSFLNPKTWEIIPGSLQK